MDKKNARLFGNIAIVLAIVAIALLSVYRLDLYAELEKEGAGAISDLANGISFIALSGVGLIFLILLNVFAAKKPGLGFVFPLLLIVAIDVIYMIFYPWAHLSGDGADAVASWLLFSFVLVVLLFGLLGLILYVTGHTTPGKVILTIFMIGVTALSVAYWIEGVVAPHGNKPLAVMGNICRLFSCVFLLVAMFSIRDPFKIKMEEEADERPMEVEEEAPNPSIDVEAELRKIKNLLDDGIISKAEFDKMKARIMKKAGLD